MDAIDPRELICSKACKTPDLGVSGNMFGGRLLEWLDEAGGIFAFKQIEGYVVTLMMSEVLFKVPVHERDVLDIFGLVKEIGKASLTVQLEVLNVKTKEKVCTCDIKYVHLNDAGEAVPISAERRDVIMQKFGLQ
ncbi:MAG TPA: hotdog domain-containing protein [Candidatus Lokiarchaeia archaeon]|nr:hotdog domain-containing protein [Candidatus Lokiarchaeia archaeon]